MINLADLKQTTELLKTGNKQIDSFGIGAFKRVTIAKNDFHFMSQERVIEMFRLLEKLCLFNHCDGLIISTAYLGNDLVPAFPMPLGEKIYFEQTSRIERVFELINTMEKKGIVMILDFDLYYCNNTTGNYVGYSKNSFQYYYDLLCEAVINSSVSVIIESQHENLNSFANFILANINDDEHLLFDNGTLTKFREL